MSVCKLVSNKSLLSALPVTFFRRALQTSSILRMPAKEGDSLPNVDLFEDTPVNKVNLVNLSQGKKLVIFAVPGAFTPGCSKTHLPGYVSNADNLKKKGVDEIVCISVNDPFVMNAWGKEHKTEGKIRMLADPSAEFTKALELEQNIAPLGGIRSKRYSMVVEDGKITSLQVEPDGTGLSCSLAEAVKFFKMNLEPEVKPETNESTGDERTPPKILKKAREVFDNLIPQVSRPKYEAAYKKFMEWRRNKKFKSFSESIILAYFAELAETKLPSTLWSTYSMLRSMIDIKHKINIFKYSSLIAFIKQKNKGFKSKKAQTLDAEQINRFLHEAPDNQYLATKVALIFGVQGACRRQELCDLTVDNIIDKGDMLLVKIPKTKTGKARYFVVTDTFYKIYKKYSTSRPSDLTTKRFFVGYRNGRCTKQNIGINTFGSIPKIVARYLKLDNPESYTGHTFRRTSATLLADSGADIMTRRIS